jgi:hypothetical protein
LVILVVLLVILLAGGGLTMQLLSGGDSSLLPVLTQVNSADASPTTVLPWKAEQFFLMVGFILFNLVGIGVTLAVVFWFLDRGVRRARAEASDAATTAPASGSQE